MHLCTLILTLAHAELEAAPLHAPVLGARRIDLLRLRGGVLEGGAAHAAHFQLHGAGTKPDEEKEFALAVDDAIQRVMSKMAPEPIIRQFRPNALAIWTTWAGTIFELIWRRALMVMLFAAAFQAACGTGIWLIHKAPSFEAWVQAPEPSLPVVKMLSSVNAVWSHLLTLTTFVLTFFLNQAFASWREILSSGRSMQGRLYDINLQLVQCAKREKRTQTYAKPAGALLAEVERRTRLLHVLFWAMNDVSLRVLHEPAGLRRLVDCGLCTDAESELLRDAGLPPFMRAQAVLAWIMVSVSQARERGLLSGADVAFVNKCCVLRGIIGGIPDKLVRAAGTSIAILYSIA